MHLFVQVHHISDNFPVALRVQDSCPTRFVKMAGPWALDGYYIRGHLPSYAPAKY